MCIVGIGLDLVHIPRIETIVSRWRNRFLERVYTDAEREALIERASPYASLAGRFAVKEAILKALGTGLSAGIRWRDIEVRTDQLGRPLATATGRAHDLLREAGVSHIYVSLAHDGEYAVAQAILTGMAPSRAETPAR